MWVMNVSDYIPFSSSIPEDENEHGAMRFFFQSVRILTFPQLYSLKWCTIKKPHTL